MRRYLIIFALLTASCSSPVPEPVPPYIPPALLAPCITPAMTADTESQFARKALRIARDRDCANQKIVTIAIIVGPQPKGK